MSLEVLQKDLQRKMTLWKRISQICFSSIPQTSDTGVECSGAWTFLALTGRYNRIILSWGSCVVMTMTSLAKINIVEKDNFRTIAITDFIKKRQIYCALMISCIGSQANLVLNDKIELSRNLAFTIAVVPRFYSQNNLFNCSLAH